MSTLTRLPIRRPGRRPTRSPAAWPMLVVEPGIRLGLGNLAIILALTGAGALGLPPTASLVVVLVVAAGSALGLEVTWAAGIGACAWAFWTGFGDHTFGLLTLAPADVLRLGLFVAASALPALLTSRTGHE